MTRAEETSFSNETGSNRKPVTRAEELAKKVRGRIGTNLVFGDDAGARAALSELVADAEALALCREHLAAAQDHFDLARAEAEALAEALGNILTLIEDANQPYERLGVGAIARSVLARHRGEK